jgi:heparanase 1
MLELSKEPIAETYPEFISFSIDVSQVLGKDWWAPGKKKVYNTVGKHEQEPFDFQNKNLIKLTKALSPAYLRIGGSRADDLFYHFSDEDKPKRYKYNLKPKTWDNINQFTNECNLKLFFNINGGPSARKKGKWQPDNFSKLLDYTNKNNYKVHIWELGNELNGYFIRGKRISGKRYAKDFARLRNVLPDAKLAGCSSAFWPKIGEPFGITGSFLKNKKTNLDFLTWHYYPQQSSRSPVATRRAKAYTMLNKKTLDGIKRWIKKIQKYQQKYSPESVLCLSETGHAQCGGQPEISDRFIAGFWWLDQLGVLAKYNHKFVIRQTLAGGDYGIMTNDFQPNPDYYNTLLWKKLMGTKVYKVKHKTHGRIYAHSHPEDENKITFLIINISKKKKLKLNINSIFEKEKELYMVTNKDLFGKDIYINNKKNQILEPIKHNSHFIEIPKTSYAFLVCTKQQN